MNESRKRNHVIMNVIMTPTPKRVSVKILSSISGEKKPTNVLFLGQLVSDLIFSQQRFGIWFDPWVRFSLRGDGCSEKN